MNFQITQFIIYNWVDGTPINIYESFSNFMSNPPFDEDLLPSPIDPYGIAKYACEMDVKIAGEQHELDWCIIRPHNFYGTNQNIWDKYRNVLGIWMYQIINDMQPTIFGDGEQRRAFSYVDDSLEPLWEASQNKNCSKQIINLGGIIEYSINEACNTSHSVLSIMLIKNVKHYICIMHNVWSSLV